MKTAAFMPSFALAMLLLIPETGCRSSDPTGETGPFPADRSSSGTPPVRIICAAPSITEIVFALGNGDQVVGVSDYSVYPPAALSKPRIGGLFNPNRERITALKPDLVITQGEHGSLHALERELGIQRLSVEIDSLADLKEAIRILGDRLERRTEARSLIFDLESRLQHIREKTQDLPRPRVFLSLGHTPGDLTGLMTAGSGTFLDELVEIAGGVNIFGNTPLLYPQISKEALILAQPDVILEICPEGISTGSRELLRQDWNRLASLHRQASVDVHFISSDYLLIPGLRLPLAAAEFARIFHGDLSLEAP